MQRLKGRDSSATLAACRPLRPHLDELRRIETSLPTLPCPALLVSRSLEACARKSSGCVKFSLHNHLIRCVRAHPSRILTVALAVPGRDPETAWSSPRVSPVDPGRPSAARTLRRTGPGPTPTSRTRGAGGRAGGRARPRRRTPDLDSPPETSRRSGPAEASPPLVPPAARVCPPGPARHRGSRGCVQVS